jgi:xanthine dehydrogenase YagS FAD-binding subunit
MKAFEYASPKGKQQVVGLLGKQWGDAEVLAGGTDLLALMKDDVVTPKRVVNIKGVDELRGVSFVAPRGLRLGALTTLAEIADNAAVRARYPVLADAAYEAASPQIRNMATIGGNMCQRPRCWYFRNNIAMKTPDGKSAAMEGDNRYHAILGNDQAQFVSPSTIAPVLIGYGAKIRLFGSGGARELPLEKFFRVPAMMSDREHDLKSDEIVTEIIVPPPAAGTKAAHYEIRQKATFDWPYVTAAAVVQMQGNKVQAARIVLSQVAPVQWLSQEAADAIVGKEINDQTADAAGAAAVANARPLSHNAYKVKLARVAVKRALLAAAKGASA